ncbi:MAG: RHS repeat-associated core domain-containing protein [Acidobacteria bacterium]|nr:RHS repeat-associated core domain-containing protein [Acidobacteriota bacterium]MBI3662855.1 RHS repeat-associated core domain-containing protein [Acidobacteriota bacterium]
MTSSGNLWVCSGDLQVGIGRRTAMCDGAGQESWSYDMMGRVLTDRRATNSVTKDFSYAYNLDSSLTTLTYPNNRVVTYAYNAAGRALSAVDTANSVNYALNASYVPQGALSSLQNGANIVSTFYYNNRLQPCRISVRSAGVSPANCADIANTGNVLDFTYGFNLGTANNGNVASIANNRDTTRSQSFTYDALNRLATAQTSATAATGLAKCWGETFNYDQWANLLSIGGVSSAYTGCTQESLSVGVNTKNQINNIGFQYAAAGNLTFDGSLSTTYDAENRIVSTNAGVTYSYDGDGKRVKKSNGKRYWYGSGSDPLEETDLSGVASADYIFFNGKRTARLDLPGAAVHYYFANHLGSASIVTSSAGVIQDESDYYPFGGERAVTDSDPNQYKFTGKERDTESGLDFFIARYYSSAYGRFLSPDEFTGGPEDAFSSSDPLPPGPLPYANISNPQSLNKYTYVLNNPLRLVDPDGHTGVTCPPKTSPTKM